MKEFGLGRMADLGEKQKRKANLYADVYKFSQNLDYDKMLKSCNRCKYLLDILFAITVDIDF